MTNETGILFVLELYSRILVCFIQDSVLNKGLRKDLGPYQVMWKNLQDVSEYFLIWPYLVWKIKEISMENHKILYFQPASVVPFILTLMHVYLQTNTTM